MDEIQSLITNKPQLCQKAGGDLHFSDQQTETAGLSVIGPTVERQVFQNNFFAVSYNLYVYPLAVIETQKHGRISPEVGPPAIDLIENISYHQTTLPLQRKPLAEPGNLINIKAACSSEKHSDDNHSGKKIHKGSGRQDNEFFPETLAGKAAPVSRVLVLPLQGAETTNGQKADGILSFIRLPVPKAGPHADRELIDAHTTKPCRQKMSNLMDCYQKAENKDCYQGKDDDHS